jgi:hypothetical protein
MDKNFLEYQKFGNNVKHISGDRSITLRMIYSESVVKICTTLKRFRAMSDICITG